MGPVPPSALSPARRRPARGLHAQLGAVRQWRDAARTSGSPSARRRNSSLSPRRHRPDHHRRSGTGRGPARGGHARFPGRAPCPPDRRAPHAGPPDCFQPPRPEEGRSMTDPRHTPAHNERPEPNMTPSSSGSPSAGTDPAATRSTAGAPTPSAPAPDPLPVPEVARLGGAVLDQVSNVVVGMRQPLRTALAAILAGGHVLFEDVPGLGKTLAARSLAGALGLDFRRLQCTPDLLPADITGSYAFDPGTTEFVFRPGPVFRSEEHTSELQSRGPKTQSALLEAMAERQVSVEGTSHPLPAPFHVLATANPVEYEGTYPLPEAQLDRLMVRLAVGYPHEAAEAEILTRRIGRRRERADVDQVITAEQLLAMQAGVESVDVDPDIVAYCVALAAATREQAAVEVGASPRGSQALLLVGRALAVLAGRDYVTPEDVKAVAVPALAHRLTLTAAAWAGGTQPERIVTGLLDTVPGPASVRRPSPAR